MQNTDRRKGTKRAVALCASLCLILIGSLSADVVEAKTPALAWQPQALDISVARGESDVFDVMVVSDRVLHNVEVVVVPELAPFITVSPSALPVMNAGVPVALQVEVAIPPATPLGVVDGTIHLNTGRRTHASVLNLVLRVGDDVGAAGGVIVSEDGRAELAIPPGAIAGDPLVFTIEEIPLAELTPPPWGELVGPAYDLGPDDAVFLKPLTLTLHYVPGDIPAGFPESSLRIAYETPTGELFGRDGFVVDTTGQTVNADVWHFTRFAIVAAADITAPEPPVVVFFDFVPDSNRTEADIAWNIPTGPSNADFRHAKIYKAFDPSVLGTVLATEITETDYILPLTDLSINCYTVRSVDNAGNESNNNNRWCIDRR